MRIENGEENGGLRKVVYSPVVKLGAKVGDEWEREVIPGMREKFTLKQFGWTDAYQEVSPDGKVFCAYIDKKVVTDVGPMLEEIQLGRGFGPVNWKSFRMEGGGRKLNWSEIVMPVERK